MTWNEEKENNHFTQLNLPYMKIQYIYLLLPISDLRGRSYPTACSSKPSPSKRQDWEPGGRGGVWGADLGTYYTYMDMYILVDCFTRY